MPEAILKFNLPEEESEHQDALNGTIYLGCIQEFDNYLRGEIKYNDSLSEAEDVLYQKIRDKLYTCAEEAGFGIWE